MSAQFGDVVEVRGKMSTRYGSCAMLASSVELIDDRFDPTAKK